MTDSDFRIASCSSAYQIEEVGQSSVSNQSLRLSPTGRKVMGKRKSLRKGLQIKLKTLSDSSQLDSPSIFGDRGVCQICELLYDNSQLISISNCEHLYCEQCLVEYVVYKLTVFEEILCPMEECKQRLTRESAVYKKLSLEMRQRFYKNDKFYSYLGDKSKQPCPQETCIGILFKKEEALKCSKCLKLYCKECFNQYHVGNCDETVARRLEQNLGYRQCSRCKVVVERDSGCEHMTCKCGYEFCYMCGKKYQAGHICPPPEIPEGLSCLQQINWLLNFRQDYVEFFHMSPVTYLHYLRLFLFGNGRVPKPLQTTIYFALIYPLTIVLSLLNFLYVFLLIHIFLILILLLLFPCYLNMFYHQSSAKPYLTDKNCLRNSLIVLAVILFPITAILVVLYGVTVMFWFNTQNAGYLNVLKAETRGNFAMIMAPCIAYMRIP